MTEEIERALAEKDYIITALCEASNRCSVCYGFIDGQDCVKCIEYYSECSCKHLTPEQIVNGEDKE